MGGPGDRRTALARARRGSRAALAAGAPDRKGSRRKESFLLALEGAAPDYLLKVNHYESLAPWRRLRRSKARAELARATMLAARGIPTPIPIAAGELRRAGLLVCCYGLVRWMPDATDLLRVWTEARDGAASRRAWTRELGVLVRRMHEAGVHQEDLAPNNFLWRPAQEPRLLAIDFERTRVGRRVPARERVFALAKLDRHFAGAPASARMRWLLAYARWESRTRAPLVARRRSLRSAARAARSAPLAAHGHATGTALRHARTRSSGRRVAWLRTSGRAARDVGRAARRRTPERVAAARARRVLVRRLEALRRREAAVAWGLAQMLYQRRLMPEPLALLRSPGAAVLVLRRSGDLVSIAEAPAAERHAALVGGDRSTARARRRRHAIAHRRVRLREATASRVAARSDALRAGTGGRRRPGARRHASGRRGCWR